MIDDHLADVEPADLQDSRNEAMHFAIQMHPLKTLFAVDLEAAAGIVDAVLHDQPAQKIRPARGEALEEGILAVLAPAADHIQLVLLHIFDHLGNIGGIVLQISIHGDDVVVLCRLYARVHRGCLPVVAAQLDELDRNEDLCEFDSFVLGAVVYEDDFIRKIHLLQSRLALAVELLNVSFLVEQWRDERNSLHANILLILDLRVSNRDAFRKTLGESAVFLRITSVLPAFSCGGWRERE